MDHHQPAMVVGHKRGRHSEEPHVVEEGSIEAQFLHTVTSPTTTAGSGGSGGQKKDNGGQPNNHHQANSHRNRQQQYAAGTVEAQFLNMTPPRAAVMSTCVSSGTSVESVSSAVPRYATAATGNEPPTASTTARGSAAPLPSSVVTTLDDEDEDDLLEIIDIRPPTRVTTTATSTAHTTNSSPVLSRRELFLMQLRAEEDAIANEPSPINRLQLRRNRYKCGPFGFKMIRSNRFWLIDNTTVRNDILKTTGGFVAQWAKTMENLKARDDGLNAKFAKYQQSQGINTKQADATIDSDLEEVGAPGAPSSSQQGADARPTPRQAAARLAPQLRQHYNALGISPTFDIPRRYPVKATYNNIIHLHRGDITALEVDAIVNAAKGSLMGGGGIDGAIHDAAGPLLVEECKLVRAASGNCPTGQTRLTKGYALPARYVLHTVGPIDHGDAELRSCYFTVLETIKAHNKTVMANLKQQAAAAHGGDGAASLPSSSLPHKWDGKGLPFVTSPAATANLSEGDRSGDDGMIRSVAFCCVSTGIFGFPLVRATHIALRCVREWMDAHMSVDEEDGLGVLGGIESIVFCIFTDKEKAVYEALMPSYFPMAGYPAASATPTTQIAVV